MLYLGDGTLVINNKYNSKYNNYYIYKILYYTETSQHERNNMCPAECVPPYCMVFFHQIRVTLKSLVFRAPLGFEVRGYGSIYTSIIITNAILNDVSALTRIISLAVTGGHLPQVSSAVRLCNKARISAAFAISCIGPYVTFSIALGPLGSPWEISRTSYQFSPTCKLVLYFSFSLVVLSNLYHGEKIKTLNWKCASCLCFM